MVQNLASVVISISLTGMLLGCGGGGTAETMAAAVNTSGLGGAGNANTGTDATGGQGNASTGTGTAGEEGSAVVTPTYSIGGTIEGLTSNGLELAMGSDTISPPAYSATFTFSQKIAAHTTYSVTVKKQPSGFQKCSIPNPFPATADATDVVNIRVTCSPVTAMVGTVAGSVAAGLLYPDGVAIDGAENIYVADTEKNRILKIAPDGVVVTLAGIEAGFSSPHGLALDSAGNVFVADLGNNRVQKITPDGVVSTFAGNGSWDRRDGTGTEAAIAHPYGLTIDSADNLFVVDHGNGCIRKITPAAEVTTVTCGKPPLILSTTAIATDAIGNLYASGYHSSTPYVPLIFKITSDGSMSIFAQNILPSGLAVDEGGNVLVSDPDYNRIQIVDPRGVARTLAGSGQQGSDDGIGSSASFLIPSALAVGMGGKIYVADKNNNRIRYLQPQ